MEEFILIYGTHKMFTITSGSIIMFLLLMVIILLIEKRNLRNMLNMRVRELAESEERWKFSLEGAGQVIWDWNIQSHKIFISRRWNETLGTDNEETLADIEEWIQEVHEDDRENMRKIITDHLRGIKPLYENFHRIRGRNGTYRWVLSRGKIIERLPDGTPLRVIGTATDVTELKQIENEARSSRQMFKLVLDTIPLGVFWKDRDLSYLGCNNSFARLIGVESADSIVGKKDIDIFDRETADSYNAVDREIFRTGISKINYEDPMSLPSGKLKVIRKSKVPLTDTTGEIIGVLGTYEDITVQKNLREETFRIQKLESVGILASGIAHDFNNLLMAISGSLSVLKISDGLSLKNLHWIEQAEKSCFAATELTTRLITFSRGGAPILQDENIIDVINEAVEAVGGGSKFRVKFRNESQLTSLSIDARQIRQVIMNLIENSKEAMIYGGSVDIVSSEIILDESNRFKLPAGKYLMISVEDTGPGISEAIIDKVFDPYFSTKEMGSQKGQGLGLAICHSIIAQHEGKITVNSLPGKGAIFTIYLPFGR